MIHEAQFYEELGRRISAARRERSLTQEQLADSVGLTRTSITNIEKGRQKVLSHLLVELSEALNASLTTLLPPPNATATAMDALPQPAREWIEKSLNSRKSI